MSFKQDVSRETTPLVSICCVTYNHKDFIDDAIKGFLMQRTTFPFEILIHDDASTDGTDAIIRRYEERYPELIKPVYEQENQYSKGTRTISPVFLWPKARGKYFAQCEGDDYWTDPYKLQKQVDFLEANPSYSAVAHQCRLIVGRDIEEGPPYRLASKSDFQLEDFLGERHFHTASFVFRSQIVRANPLPKNIISVDRVLFLLCSISGPIRFIPDAMAVYRKHKGGISSWITSDLMKNDLSIIPWMESIYPDFPSKRYKYTIYRGIVFYPAHHGFVELSASTFWLFFYSLHVGLRTFWKTGRDFVIWLLRKP